MAIEAEVVNRAILESEYWELENRRWLSSGRRSGLMIYRLWLGANNSQHLIEPISEPCDRAKPFQLFRKATGLEWLLLVEDRPTPSRLI
jgi:hypothetical protein